MRLIWREVLNDVDIEPSISCNALDNECRAHEYSDTFMTDKL